MVGLLGPEARQGSSQVGGNSFIRNKGGVLMPLLVLPLYPPVWVHVTALFDTWCNDDLGGAAALVGAPSPVIWRTWPPSDQLSPPATEMTRTRGRKGGIRTHRMVLKDYFERSADLLRVGLHRRHATRGSRTFHGQLEALCKSQSPGGP